MATSVKLPGIGSVDKKWVYGGGALVAGIAGYAYWMRSRADAAEPGTADYTSDPGVDYAYDSPTDEYVNPGGSQAPVNQDWLSRPSNNIEWGQLAVSTLIDTNYEPGPAAIAVGLFLARSNLSTDQANMIRAVTGMIGFPPSGSFEIKSTPTPETPTTIPGKDLKAPTDLKTTIAYRQSVEITWKRVPGAAGYRLYREGVAPNIGHSVDNIGRIIGLLPNKTYRVYVRAMGADGGTGPASPKLTIKTKK